MIEENKLLFGICSILFGVAFLYFRFKDRNYDKERAWDIAMLFKALVGGLAFIIIGIVLILMKYQVL